MEFTIGNHPDLIKKAHAIRKQVFVIEQGIPQALDLDGLDGSADHVLVTKGEELIATARLYYKRSGYAVMARIAVLQTFRGLGVATKMVKALLDHTKQRNIKTIEIHAHQYLRSYYEKFGFKFIKEVETVGEHQLIEMKYQY